jgi:Ca-activated chloride channel family protein
MSGARRTTPILADRTCRAGRGVILRLAMVLVAALWPGFTQADGLADWLLTPDQQGQRLFENGEFLAAAEAFEEPARRGAAYFRGGDFESAASVYGRLRSPEAAYNRGNALVMLGRYEEAIESYGRALDGRPDWAEAKQNQEIARARLERLAPPDDDAGGTGGMLEADELVFDKTGRVNESGSEAVTAGGEMSEEELRAVWLRRVENDPADFLRARFAYQLYRDEQESAGE